MGEMMFVVVAVATDGRVALGRLGGIGEREEVVGERIGYNSL